MKKLNRCLQLVLCTLTLAAATLYPAKATAQMQPIPYSVTGLMSFNMHSQFANTIKAQGIHYNYIGYAMPTTSTAGGFPVIAGTLIGGNGYGTGELQCSGDMQYVSGALTMDLRSMQYSNAYGVTMSAAIFLNGIYQGRQILFTSVWNELSDVSAGGYISQNSYLSMDPAFAKLFVTFFQTPQLANDANFTNFGFVNFGLSLQAI